MTKDLFLWIPDSGGLSLRHKSHLYFSQETGHVETGRGSSSSRSLVRWRRCEAGQRASGQGIVNPPQNSPPSLSFNHCSKPPTDESAQDYSANCRLLTSLQHKDVSPCLSSEYMPWVRIGGYMRTFMGVHRVWLTFFSTNTHTIVEDQVYVWQLTHHAGCFKERLQKKEDREERRALFKGKKTLI